MECPDCEAEINRNSNFCPECGVKIEVYQGNDDSKNKQDSFEGKSGDAKNKKNTATTSSKEGIKKRRLLGILGTVGVIGGGLGYKNLRGLETLIEEKSVNGVEQVSFTVNSKTFIQYPYYDNRETKGMMVVYDSDSLTIRAIPTHNEVLRVDGPGFVVPPGTYNISAIVELPEIKSTSFYYFRGLWEGANTSIMSAPLTDIIPNIADLGTKIFKYRSIFEEHPTNLINWPGEGITRRSLDEHEATSRMTKRVFDPIFQKADPKAEEEYGSAWNTFEEHISSCQIVGQISQAFSNQMDMPVIQYINKNISTGVNGIFRSSIVSNITNIIDSNVNVQFYATRATVEGNRANVPVGLILDIDSDIPTVDQDTMIFTDTFDVPGVLRPPSPGSNIVEIDYAQWEIDYENIITNISDNIEESLNGTV